MLTYNNYSGLAGLNGPVEGLGHSFRANKTIQTYLSREDHKRLCQKLFKKDMESRTENVAFTCCCRSID